MEHTAAHSEHHQLKHLQYPRFARRWMKLSAGLERRGVAELRKQTLSGLSGRVIEVGCGNGLNFRHYPAEVREVIAVEPDATLRAAAEGAAETAPVPVSVVAGHADDLPGAEGSYDAAVATLVLCSVPEPASSVAELRRVLRPGGQLRLLEHVRANNRLAARFQDLISPISAKLDAGCRQGRDTASAVRDAGFAVSGLERFSFPDHPWVPGQPMICGTAVLTAHPVPPS